MFYRTAAIISLDAIRHNIMAIRKKIKPETRLMAIIKADGYGHGAVPIAKMLDKLDNKDGVSFQEVVYAYGVAIVEEGVELRKNGVKKPILLLGYTAREQISQVAEYELTQTVYSYEMAKYISDEGLRLNRTINVNIKVETGMGRIGFIPDEASISEIAEFSQLKGIRITGMFSHLARADEADKSAAYKQFKVFNEFSEKLERAGVHIPIRHISNSAASMELNDFNLDMVRFGIALYGLYPSEEMNKKAFKLIPALEWKARISFVKNLPKGYPISYGGIFTTKRESIIATVPVGYADGYPRQLSSKGRVIINGHFAPICGRICMDQFMIDVTDIPEVKTGDIVTLIGCDGDVSIPIEEPAALAGSFNYELACDISRRVPRIYTGGKDV